MIFIPSLESDPEISCYNENGEKCSWPYDPLFLDGAPLGQYHCPFCGAMIMAGLPHIDWGDWILAEFLFLIYLPQDWGLVESSSY